LAKKLHLIFLYRQSRVRAVVLVILTLGVLLVVELVRGSRILPQMLAMLSVVLIFIGLGRVLWSRREFMDGLAALPHRRFVFRLSDEGAAFVGPRRELNANWAQFQWLKRSSAAWVLDFKDVGRFFAPGDALDQETRDFILDKYTNPQPTAAGARATAGSDGRAPSGAEDAPAAESAGRTVSFELTDEIAERIYRVTVTPSPAAMRLGCLWMALFVVPVLGICVIRRTWVWLGVLAAVPLVVWIAWQGLVRYAIRSYVSKVGVLAHRRVTVTIGSDGMVVADAQSTTPIPWDSVRTVERSEELLILRSEHGGVLIAIPAEVLDDETSEEIRTRASATGPEIA